MVQVPWYSTFLLMLLFTVLLYAGFQIVMMPVKYLDEGEKALKFIKKRERERRREKREKKKQEQRDGKRQQEFL